MATRLYPAGGTPAISPAVASGWENAGALIREVGSSNTADYVQSNPTTSGSGSANEDTACLQMIYGPITGATITGTVKGQMGARESNAAADARAQVTIRVIAPDASTVRGTLLAMDTAALSSEFIVDTADRQNRKVPRGGAQSLTSTVAQDGDYIVIEYGFRNHGTNTGAVRISNGPAGAAGDLPENETQTVNAGNDYRGWFEFSQTIAPYTGVTGGPAAATGAALDAKLTIAPTVSTATATGAAYDATVSLATPPRTATINSADYTSDILLAGFSLTECANRGEVGTGGFDVLDSTAVMDIPALKAVLVEEPAAGSSNKRLYTGFTHDRTTEALRDQALTAREWAVECTDLNILASDYVLTEAETANRPAETDYVRVAWLLTSALNSVGGVGVGVVPNTNTVTMEATDYRGRMAADVLAECSEAAGKLWFIYDYGAGRLMYYDLATGTSLSSSVKISDAAGDPNGSTVFAVESVRVRKSPDRIYSKIHLTYNGGTVTATDAGVAATYRQREAHVMDTSITTSALATIKANELLAGAAAELTEVEGLELFVSAAHVNDIRAGQRVEIKLTRHGIAAYTFYRVIRRTVQPLNGPSNYYAVSLGLASDVLASANGARGSYEVWQHSSNSTDDGATVTIDESGLNIIDGALTVVNSGATVIIDGESDIFKIAAEGTQSILTLVGTTNAANTTLSGLGALAACPALIPLHALSNVSTTAQIPGMTFFVFDTAIYGAATSGGAVTKQTVGTTRLLWGTILLDGSSEAVVTVGAGNTSASNFTAYQKYFVLVETGF